MIKQKQLVDLADITGEDFFSSELYMRKLYSQDIASLPGIVNDIIGTLVDAVAQPVSTEVVSNLLKYCKKHKIPVIPRGHGTSGYGGALSTKRGLAIEMTRMNEVYNIDKEAMTVQVGAGIIWGRLLEILEDEGLSLPTYPSSAPSSTVGGWVAAGGTGIGSTKYGGIRDQVIDLEVVLPDGEILNTNEASDDFLKSISKTEYVYSGSSKYHWHPEDSTQAPSLTSLFIDSNGALGIITKVTLKIIKLNSMKPFVATFKSSDEMIGAMKGIMTISSIEKHSTKPFYLHHITEAFYKMLEDVGQAPETSHPWLILCAYEGTEEELSGSELKFREIVEKNNGVVESDEIGEHEWQERFYPLRVKRLGPSIAPSEVYVPLEKLGDFIAHVDKHFKGEKLALEGAVTNNKEVAVLAWFLDDERRTIPFLMGWYRSLDFIDIGIKQNGRAYSIGMWNVAHSRSYFGEKTYKDMSQLKKKTDPKGIMNPNKVFSGTLQLSLRLNLLIVLIAAIVAPIVLWVAGFFVADIINAYVPWLMITDATSVIIASILGLIVGTVVVEFANMIPISFVLTIGGPFMRLGRKIFH